MTGPVWRPVPHIRTLAIGLHWRGAGLLGAEVLDDAGRVKGMRPLGGGVEFGERWADALVREFREELGAAIVVTGPPIVLENIYVHEGAQGHEVVFAAPVEFAEPPEADVLRFAEDNGTQHIARWFDPFAPGAPPLFPEGLRGALVGQQP
ncbi:MAG: NUDIX domain-containing protein [Pseudomonadota bacterium]